MNRKKIIAIIAAISMKRRDHYFALLVYQFGYGRCLEQWHISRDQDCFAAFVFYL